MPKELVFNNGDVTDRTCACPECDFGPLPVAYNYCPHCGTQL